MKNHHFRYILSLTLLAAVPEIYFLSRLSILKVSLIFLIAFIGLLFMMPVDIGFTRGGKTNPKKWVWEFNEESILNLKLFKLPIEEYIFVLVWVPLPIAIWEYIKNIQLQTSLVITIFILCAIMIYFIYPILLKPNK